MKKLLFVRNPEYKQRINSDIKYTFHENGIVKCDFTKEVWGTTAGMLRKATCWWDTEIAGTGSLARVIRRPISNMDTASS